MAFGLLAGVAAPLISQLFSHHATAADPAIDAAEVANTKNNDEILADNQKLATKQKNFVATMSTEVTDAQEGSMIQNFAFMAENLHDKMTQKQIDAVTS